MVGKWIDRLAIVTSYKWQNCVSCSNRTVLLRGLFSPYALTIYNDQLYWADLENKSIVVANKYTGAHQRYFIEGIKYPVADLHAFSQNQMFENGKLCIKSKRREERGMEGGRKGWK